MYRKDVVMNPKIAQWLERREEILMGGGPDKIEKQHSQGKLTVRERIDYLLDPDSFQELGMFVKHHNPAIKRDIPADGIVMGYGTIDGRPVYVYGHDFTAQGGSFGEMSCKKMVEIARRAVEAGVPLISLNDSGGGRIQEGPLNTAFNELFYYNVQGSGWIPQLSAIMGPCAGGAAYSPALTDFIFMVDKTSNMFLTGPNVIKQVMGEEVDKETLGGARTHATKSGMAHFVAANDYDCIDQMKRLLSFLPQNADQKPPVYLCEDDPERLCPELDDIIPLEPRKTYDVKNVITAIADYGDYMEIMQDWAKNVVTALIRIKGQTVGVFANQPKHLAGSLDLNASDKGARFIRFCDSFNIPLVYLTDVPGYMPGTVQEFGGIIRHGAKLVYANAEATVPKIVIVMHKVFGGGKAGMCSRGLKNDMYFFWPMGESAIMGAEGAISVINRKELAAATDEDRPALKEKLIQQYNEKFGAPYEIMRNMYADEIIMPSETRRVIYRALKLLEHKNVHPIVHKKHDNQPL